MTLVYNDHVKDINNLLDNPYKDSGIKLVKFTDMTLHLLVYDIPVTISTDFETYCMAESPHDTFDLTMFNMMLAFENKDPTVIIERLMNISNNKDKPIVVNKSDPFHIYQKFDEYTKYKIDYVMLKASMISSLSSFSSAAKKSLTKIPKGMLLSPEQSVELIINEIKKVNRNRDFEHYIVCDMKLPFTLYIRIKFNNMSPMGMLFKEIKHDYMELKLHIDPLSYPFIPPKLEHSKPNIMLPLLMSIMNLDILKFDNWLYTIDLEYLITNLGNQLEKVDTMYIMKDDSMNIHKELEVMLISFGTLTKETSTEQLITIKVPKLNNTSSSNSKYWKSGTGYGNDSTANWDIKSYIKEMEHNMEETIKMINKINNMITIDNINIILDSVFTVYIMKQLSGLNMLELEKNNMLYTAIFNVLSNIVDKNISQNVINKICDGLKNFYEELNIMISSNKDILSNELILQTFCIADYYMGRYIEPVKPLIIATNIKDEYCLVMKKLQFGSTELSNTHRFIQHKTEKPAQKSLMRMISEISSFKNNLPLNWESSIWLRVPKDNFNLFTFLISGPKDTPYENGLFEFHAYLPQDYPNSVPHVLLCTTGNDTVRFNPNLYNTGKVCLSILGTWQGSESEKWNAKTSTFLQVLISIQALILVPQPFFNEPGYEREINTPQGKKRSDEYNEEKEPHTINLAMVQMIRNPPKGYEEIVLNHFRMKKDEIITRTLIWEQRATKHSMLIKQHRKELIELLNKL
jgi:ubiquitin-protein ligase